ncbi:hypothetical protein NITMOv2_4694 [Nitrospira moscoviensis]|uniref:Uncharacterized protein n=1 Tax=Nitrospira moscoviensis TaxID=42253 RepID=A0A0K2G6G2_NITMO|nr:hypothetical protein NITMOv2_0087 [Nitrospira moscoviensis]ALA61064.1 hypothetical protein NITMOv2_4694 [Nitrospira moscoviensis]
MGGGTSGGVVRRASIVSIAVALLGKGKASPINVAKHQHKKRLHVNINHILPWYTAGLHDPPAAIVVEIKKISTKCHRHRLAYCSFLLYSVPDLPVRGVVTPRHIQSKPFRGKKRNAHIRKNSVYSCIAITKPAV